MAERAAPLFPPGTVAKGIQGLFDQSDLFRNSAYAAAAGKSQADTQRILRQNAQGDAVRQGLIDGKSLPELQVLAGDNAELQDKLPAMWRARIYNTPNSTQQQRDLSFGGAGGAYGGTQSGFQAAQAGDTERSRIAAGPGYAAAAASRYGHNLNYQAARDRLAQEGDQWRNKPMELLGPNGEMGFGTQGELPTKFPVGSGFAPYSPEGYKAANTPVQMGGAPGQPNVQMRLGDFSRYTAGGGITPAPVPAEVQVARDKPIPLIPPGETEPREYPASVVVQNPGTMTSPRTGADNPAPKANEAITLGQDADFDAEQAIRGLFNVAAGRTDAGYLLTDRVGNSAIQLPKEWALKMPDLVARVHRYAQFNKGNLGAAAQQVIGEEFGDPGSQGGFTINRGMGILSPTITYGAKRAPLPLQATPENYPTPSPTSTRGAPRPAGSPVPPPSPVTALAPQPAPPPVYRAGGASPAPTINLGGNPSPPPAPVAPAQPPAPTAPTAPAQPPAQMTRPANLSDADIIAQGQLAVRQGKDPAAVRQVLQSWGVTMPGP